VAGAGGGGGSGGGGGGGGGGGAGGGGGGGRGAGGGVGSSGGGPELRRQVPVQVVIDFDLVDAEKSIPNLIMPSLEPLAAGGVAAPPEEWTRMVQHFSSPEHVTEPNRVSVNDMYL